MYLITFIVTCRLKFHTAISQTCSDMNFCPITICHILQAYNGKHCTFQICVHI
jgi:hypothetical protein